MSQAYMSSPASETLVNTLNTNLAHIRANPSDKANAGLFIEVVNLMTEEAMDYYFHRPMDIIEAGKITRKFVNMGVAGAKKMVKTMGTKATGSLSEDQLLQLCDFIESLIEQS